RLGVDIFPENLHLCRFSGYFSDVVLADIRRLPFKANSFDTVLCSHVIEHLHKKDGFQLINQINIIASKQIIIITPVGLIPVSAHHGNSWEEHKSGWAPVDLESLGYRCIGIGSPKFL